MLLQRDKKGQLMIEWPQGDNGWKRAWIRKPEAEKDWAGTGRYINVVRVDGPNIGTGGQSTDFPIFNSPLSEEQLLIAFVTTICAMTGCEFDLKASINAEQDNG